MKQIKFKCQTSAASIVAAKALSSSLNVNSYSIGSTNDFNIAITLRPFEVDLPNINHFPPHTLQDIPLLRK